MAGRILWLALVWSCPACQLLAQDNPTENGTHIIEAKAPTPEDGQTEQPAPDAKQVGRIVRYVEMNPVDDGVFTRIRNTLVTLQRQAEEEQRESVLILEIARGTSTFGQVLDLANELTSSRYSKVRTVAWIPGDGPPLNGYMAILPLACHEIVMHPDAVVGDIGRGQPIAEHEQQFVVDMVGKRHNPRVNAALAAGLCDPQRTVLLVKIDSGDGPVRTLVVTGEEIRRLQDIDIAIPEIVTIKEQGKLLLLSGREAHGNNVLVTHNAEDRRDLADIYGFERSDMREDVTGGEAPRARLIKIEGPITELLAESVTGEIRRATAADANLIIFEIDSPVGKLFASESIANAITALDPKSCRSIAYVPRQAISGGAMIAFACDEIILHPDGRIGDMLPAVAQPGGWAEHVPEKVLSVVREMLNELAERKGRAPALLEAMADRNLVVYTATHRQTGRVSYMSAQELEAVADEWKKGAAVPESREGVVLTLTGQRAFELEIAEQPVSNFDELKLRLGIPTDQVIEAADQAWVAFAALWLLVASIAIGITYYMKRRGGSRRSSTQ